MAKGPGVSATSRIIAQSQTNIHYYSDLPKRMQPFFIPVPASTPDSNAQLIYIEETRQNGPKIALLFSLHSDDFGSFGPFLGL
ncbi:hypothetical protein [Cohnella faecalis]|uniref:hypothetical protein n=1 Tax=Cohnella faecalis TaxID=2315694 RepID=UPI0011C228D7|nr:hypothetical protein [Cohnella faecalis]